MALIKSISGIRGTIGGNVGENLTPLDIVNFTASFVSLLQQIRCKKQLLVVVGRDGRSSGQVLNSLICATLQNMGTNVIDVGLSTTPAVEMAVPYYKADGGIIITASHNPMDWNALKLLNEFGEFISGKEAEDLFIIAEKKDFIFAKSEALGRYIVDNKAIDRHIEEILKLPLIDKQAISKANFSIAADVINSTGSIALPLLLKKLGVNNIKILNGEISGNFSHNPEPLKDHLSELITIMAEDSYNVGFAVDPDVDRLAIISENGEMFGEEYTLISVADYILKHEKGNIVSNLSSTQSLFDIAEKYDVAAFQSAVGEVNVTALMKDVKAVIGGEGNGGIIYPQLHYGRDALVGIALFLTYLAQSNIKCSELRKKLPSYFISKNKIELNSEWDIKYILSQIIKRYRNLNPITIDGIKIIFDKSWVHIRVSNTEPVIRIYSEAATEQVAIELIEKIKKDIYDIVK